MIAGSGETPPIRRVVPASSTMEDEDKDEIRCKYCGKLFTPEDEVRTTRDICDDCLDDITPFNEIFDLW